MSSARSRRESAALPPLVRTTSNANVVVNVAIALFAIAALAMAFGQLPRKASATEPLDPVAESRTQIATHPFDFVGFAGLADVALDDERGRGDALRALSVAKHLAPNDPLVMRAEFRLAEAVGNRTRAMDRAAKLLDISPLDASEALQKLANLTEDPAWPSFAEARMRDGWPAADRLLRYMCERNIDLNRLLLFAHQIARNRAVATAALHCVEHKLVNAGAVEAAYHLRLVGGPRSDKRMSFVFNGEFDHDPIGSPFDWVLTQGGEYRAGFDVTIRRGTESGRPGGKLYVRFNGRPVKAPVVQQNLALIPGKYRLTTSATESGLGANEAPSWFVRCTGGNAPALDLQWTEQFDTKQWVRRTAVFEIAKECAGQRLSLEVSSRLKALEGMRGSVLIDAVSIEKL